MSRQPTPLSRNSPASTPGPSQPPVTDLYRPLAAQIQKPLIPLAGSSSSNLSLPALLGTDISTFNSRLSGKAVFLTDVPSTTAPSALVTGRKRNRGDPKALAATKAEQAKQAGTSRRALLTPATRIDYASILPLNYLHNRYMAQLLDLQPAASDPGAAPSIPHGATLHQKLVKADFTGANVSVKAAKNESLIGVSGIVVEETAGSFRLVGEDGKVRVIPKVGAQFAVSFPLYARVDEEWEEFMAKTPRVEVEILGSAFAFRSGDRAGRKFRPVQGGGGGCGWGEAWVGSQWGNLLNGLGEVEPYPREKRRKRNKHRRKDPLAQGSLMH